MICTPCTNGQHCGPPGQASARCPCQHLAPGTGQAIRAPGRDCTQDGAPVGVSAPSGAFQAPSDLRVRTHESTGRTAPLATPVLDRLRTYYQSKRRPGR